MSRASGAVADVAHAAPLFAALGDETRLALVNRLCVEGPQSIVRLTTGSTLTRQAITKHLTVLAAADLVHDSRRGRERVWTIDVDRLNGARRYLAQISQQWDEALERLRQFTEDENAVTSSSEREHAGDQT